MCRNATTGQLSSHYTFSTLEAEVGIEPYLLTQDTYEKADRACCLYVCVAPDGMALQSAVAFETQIENVSQDVFRTAIPTRFIS